MRLRFRVLLLVLVTNFGGFQRLWKNQEIKRMDPRLPPLKMKAYVKRHVSSSASVAELK